MSEMMGSKTLPTLREKLLELATLAFAIELTFLIINWIHFQFLAVAVILYACILDAVLASVIVLGIFRLVWWQRTALLSTEAVLTAISANLLILLYAVMGPTVIDRSLSIYIVQKIDMRGGRVAETAMPDIFVKEYLPEFRLADVRMTEQVQSGTVVIEDGCVILTDKGRTLSRFAAFYRKNFLPKRRVLMDEVSDILTDPFRNTKAIVDVTCPQDR